LCAPMDGTVFYIWVGFEFGFRLLGEVLSLACPRESTQRERHPVACPGINLRFMPGSPVLLGKTGARATRDLAALDYAQTGASFFRFSLRCSAAPNGVLGGVPEPVVLAKHRWIPAFAGMTGHDRAQVSTPTLQPVGLMPVGAAEHRSHFGIERAALSELDLQAVRRGKSCEFGERLKWREAQGHPRSGQASGSAFLLGTFLWRSKEKYLAREGRNIGQGMPWKSIDCTERAFRHGDVEAG